MIRLPVGSACKFFTSFPMNNIGWPEKISFHNAGSGKSSQLTGPAGKKTAAVSSYCSILWDRLR